MFEPDDKTDPDPWAIPDFCRRPKGWRPAPLNGKRLRWTKDMRFAPPPTREEEAATKALRKEIAAMAEAKKKAALERLRQYPSRKKRGKTSR